MGITSALATVCSKLEMAFIAIIFALMIDYIIMSIFKNIDPTTAGMLSIVLVLHYAMRMRPLWRQ